MWPRWSLRRSKVCLYLFLGKRFIFGKTGRFPSRGSNLDLSTIVVFQSMSPATIGRASAQVGRSRSSHFHRKGNPLSLSALFRAKTPPVTSQGLRKFHALQAPLAKPPRAASLRSAPWDRTELPLKACQACTGAEQRGSRSRPFCIRLLLG